MKTIEPLLYGMSPLPINMDMYDVAKRLKHGQPVMVQLEPGDATHYGLLIVPCWADHVAPYLGRYGIQEHRSTDYLIVSYLHDTYGDTFYVSQDVDDYDWRIKNEWTRRFFVWWFLQLWEHIGALV